MKIRTATVLVALLPVFALSTVNCGGPPSANSSARRATESGALANAALVGTGHKTGTASSDVVDLVPQLGHSAAIEAVSIAPSGKVAATASADKTVRVWDVLTGILLRQLSIGSTAWDVDILQDGVRAVVVAQDDVQLWDLLQGQPIKKFTTDNSAACRATVMHRDGFVVLGDAAGGIELWDLTQLKRVRHLAPERPGGTYGVEALDVSFDDRLVAAALQDGTIQLIDSETGRLVHNLVGHASNVNSTQFSRNATQLVSFGDDGTIRQWDVASGKETHRHRLGDSVMKGALVNDDTALIADYWGKPRLVDLVTGRDLRGLEPWPGVPHAGISSVAVTADGRRAVLGNHNKSILFSNLNDGSPIHATVGRRNGAFSLAMSSQGNRLAVGYGGAEVDVWDTVMGARLYRIPYIEDDRGTGQVALSPNGRLLVRAEGSNVHVHDARSGELLRKLRVENTVVQGLAVSPDGKVVAVSGWGTLYAFDLESGRLVWSVSDQNYGSVAFSPDGAYLVVGTMGKETLQYDAHSGVKVSSFQGPVFGAKNIEFWDSNVALLGADNLGLWDLRQGTQSVRYSDPRDRAGVATFTLDHKWVLSGDGEGTITAYDTQTHARVQQFSAHTDRILAIIAAADEKNVFSTSFDGTVRVVPVDTLIGHAPTSDPRPMVWVADNEDWLAYSADGYFDASRRGGRLVAAVRGFEGYRVDQLAARNNRPDIMLARVGLGTRASLDVFSIRHQQRIKRLGFDERELEANLMAAPRAAIVEFSQMGKQARLSCSFDGNGRRLKRYFVFVNDVAVGDGEGTPLAGVTASATVEVELSAGRNKIELSVLNDAGLESFRDVRTANVSANVHGDLYYLGFGVSRYADSRMSLKYAHKDALDLGRTVEQMAGRGYDRVFTRTLTDGEVTTASIKAARAFLAKAKLDDTVIVFVAGHGVLGQGPSGRYYFVTHDTDVARLQETGVSFDLIEDLVTGILPRKKLLLLDTCQSGERDSDEEVVRVSAGTSRGLAARGIRPVVMDSGKPVGSRSRIPGNQDRYIFNDLSRRSGTIVFSASRGSELSYEDDRLTNGTFTYELVRALTGSSADVDHDGAVSTDELRAYVSKAVTNRTAGLQNPTVDRDNLEALFGFPIVGQTPALTPNAALTRASLPNAASVRNPLESTDSTTNQGTPTSPKRTIRRLPQRRGAGPNP